MNDWRGWLIEATDWHAPLYIAGEMPPGHIAWTGEMTQALGFRKKKEAEEWVERMGTVARDTMKVRVKFHPWRTASKANEVQK